MSDPTRILNRDILLVDDVLTTGTTASECARVVRRAWAARVWVATVARTLKISDGFTLAGSLPNDSLQGSMVEKGSAGCVDVVAHG